MSEAIVDFKFPAQGDQRGTYRAVTVGTSFEGRQKILGILCQTPHNQVVLNKLMSSSSVKRISVASSMFAFHAPKLYRDYATKLDQLHEHYHELHYN
ncbi:hypothetical protein PsYK624_170050 [Phanerochaete sordida]|uniref:Uncharacterized protein n=1 Tax=Phanerochaete sordida TaxID=48140 RepID=A0A9P3LMM1_9APHY|nr:hypothetical protein PsYK624_170050 [Phanerochaete sordida]